ncbi:serine hydrolase domain-containing protein [Pontibacter mangrovi]|uniref:Beta-lactamase family protein n=1 Tax=Pontibacter mangrovi TaxID=2589816 RepID=A0A501W593_9BACT|nr:serine hydrolase domain-containing protein [Pontibacter mangrovi]TPE43264.1 beta-lactamase family protein [Pontibacter mangrovi]
MMLKYIALLLFAMGSVAARAQESPVDTFLLNQMQKFHIPAVSVAIIENGEVVLSKAYGTANLEYNIPNTTGTAFQLASATKLLAATALMTLVQEGKLDLQQKVRTYLPQLPKAWDDMRVMDLVAHQSGIVDLLALQHNFKSADAALDTAMARPLDFAPGTKTVYAGGDYAVVMKLIDKVAGMPYQQFLDERLLRKLGMRHTVYNNMEQDFIYRTYDTIPYAATVYKWVGEKPPQQRVFSMVFPSWTYPAGGLFSSIDDLAKWAVALDKNTLLKPEVAAQMWTAAKLRDGKNAPFGVGWIVDKHNGEKATGHSGGPALADIVRLPERKITAIVLTNQLELRPFLTMRVLDLYLENKQLYR